jgi:hypothetical protein
VGKICAGDWVKNPLTPPTQARGKCPPNREEKKVSEHAITRLNISTASQLIIANDLVGVVQSRDKLKDEILLLYQQDTREKTNSDSLGLLQCLQLSLANKI